MEGLLHKILMYMWSPVALVCGPLYSEVGGWSTSTLRLMQLAN